MSRVSTILILSYRPKKMPNSYAFFIVKEDQRFAHISGAKCPIVIGFGSKCSSLKGHVAYIENLKLNFSEM